MDKPNLDRYAELIDYRLSTSKELTQSIIDNYTTKLRLILNDPTLHAGFVAKIIQNLSEADINDFADYCVRKADNPGRAFVGLCEKTMKYKSLT
jgi:hypothetical protein